LLSNRGSITFNQLNFSYDVIIAHGPGCNDGATAAWSFWRTLPREYRELLAKEGGFYSKPEKAEKEEYQVREPYIHPSSPEGAIKLQDRGFPVVFVFIQPSEGVPTKLIENKRVLILDLDMGDALIPVVATASYTFLSDHHDSTLLTIHKHSDFLLNRYRYKFGMYINTSKSESGATLAWRLSHNAEIPPLVQTVRIGDTWQWNEYPELQARYVLKALHIRRSFRSFPDIEGTYINWTTNFQSHIQKGHAVSEFENALVKQAAKRCNLGFIQTNDGTVYTIAYTQADILYSEIGSSMKWYAEQRFKVPIHFCVTWKYVSYKGIVCVSLRDAESGINLASIARNIKGSDGKGGGHAEAAGFSFFGLENFHNFILKDNQNRSVNVTQSSSIQNMDHQRQLPPHIQMPISDFTPIKDISTCSLKSATNETLLSPIENTSSSLQLIPLTQLLDDSINISTSCNINSINS
jgi:hypothetical protein